LGYLFTRAGRHTATVDLTTGRTLLTFGYTDGHLSSITDRFGREVTIEWSGNLPTAIVSPHQVRTELEFRLGTRLLETVRYPDGAYYRMDYSGGGLMTGMCDPRQNAALACGLDHFGRAFDGHGRLLEYSVTEEVTTSRWNYARGVLADGTSVRSRPRDGGRVTHEDSFDSGA
jgi:hypothetical protein